MSSDKIGHERHGILITNCTDVVQEENVLDLQIIDHFRQRSAVYIGEITIVQNIDMLIIFY